MPATGAEEPKAQDQNQTPIPVAVPTLVPGRLFSGDTAFSAQKATGLWPEIYEPSLRSRVQGLRVYWASAHYLRKLCLCPPLSCLPASLSARAGAGGALLKGRRRLGLVAWQSFGAFASV